MLDLSDVKSKKCAFLKKSRSAGAAQKTSATFYTGVCSVPGEQKFFAELFYKKAAACLPSFLPSVP
jgi:hypothetical protein